MNNLIKNNKGFSLAEIMVALGIVGVIGIGVAGLIKQTNNLKRESQSDSAIDQAFKDIQNILSYSEQNNDCETSLGGSLNNPSITARKTNGSIRPYFPGREISPTVRLTNINSTVSPGFPSTGKTQILVEVTFSQAMGNGNTKTIRKSFVRPVGRSASGAISCKEFDASLVESASLQSVCDEVGGTVNGTSCDFDPTVIDPDLEERMKRFACSLFGDMNNYTNGLCNQIETDTAYGDNISPAQVCINGSDCRNTFESTNCPSGEFLTGVSTSGYKSCSEINFVGQGNACIPNCSCKHTTPIGETCKDGCGGDCNGIQPVCSPSDNCSCVTPSLSANSYCNGNDGCGTTIQCYGRNCDYLDSYSRSGSNCNFRNYSQGSSPGAAGCTNFTNTSLPTPTCKQIQSGTCSGSTPPSYTNVANGTACGGGNVCQNGNCVGPAPSDCTISLPIAWSSGSSTCGHDGSGSTATLTHGEQTSFVHDRGGGVTGSILYECNDGARTVVGKNCGPSGGGGGAGGGGGGFKETRNDFDSI